MVVQCVQRLNTHDRWLALICPATSGTTANHSSIDTGTENSSMSNDLDSLQ
jgi:hypothetical protein